MSWIEALSRKKRTEEMHPVVILEIIPPTEQERQLISKVILKLTDQGELWRRQPVYNWNKALDVVKRLPDHGLTADEKNWLLGRFEPEMSRCAEESRRSPGYFYHVIAVSYPEGYIAVRAGGFEVPILSPAEIKWGGQSRNARVRVLEQWPGSFEGKPMFSPNDTLRGHMRVIVEGNMSFLNDVFGFCNSELDITVVNERRFGLMLGRKRPGVFIHVLPQLDPVTAIQS